MLVCVLLKSRPLERDRDMKNGTLLLGIFSAGISAPFRARTARPGTEGYLNGGISSRASFFRRNLFRKAESSFKSRIREELLPFDSAN
jgi:hypothetical protein